MSDDQHERRVNWGPVEEPTDQLRDLFRPADDPSPESPTSSRTGDADPDDLGSIFADFDELLDVPESGPSADSNLGQTPGPEPLVEAPVADAPDTEAPLAPNTVVETSALGTPVEVEPTSGAVERPNVARPGTARPGTARPSNGRGSRRRGGTSTSTADRSSEAAARRAQTRAVDAQQIAESTQWSAPGAEDVSSAPQPDKPSSPHDWGWPATDGPSDAKTASPEPPTPAPVESANESDEPDEVAEVPEVGSDSGPLDNRSNEAPDAASANPAPAHSIPRDAISEPELADLHRRAALEEEERRRASMDQYVTAATTILELAGQQTALATEMRRMVLTRDPELDARQRREFQTMLEPVMARANVTVADPRDVAAIFDVAYDQMLGLGPLGPLWRDDSVTEIMVNAYDQIFAEQGGRILDTNLRFTNPDHVRRIARDLAAKVSDRSLSIETPLVTAELPGARVNFVYGPIAKTSTVITIRKFSALLGVESLLERQALTQEMLDFLRDCVRARANIVVSGGTGSGKTTIINVLSSFIPRHERVVSIEDAFELGLTNHHVVSLQTKERASGDDRIVVSQSELMINALRMRPDRIIIGEVRDGDAALVLMDAANTGHDGTMTTIHGNSAALTLNDRLVVMIRSSRNIPDDVARRSVASAINVVVQVSRKGHGRRLVTEIAVVDQSYIHDQMITPRPVFIGHLDHAGTPRFSRVGTIEPGTDLAGRFESTGVDGARWIEVTR